MSRGRRIGLVPDDLTHPAVEGTRRRASLAGPADLSAATDAGSRERAAIALQATAGNQAVVGSVQRTLDGVEKTAVQRWPGRRGAGPQPVEASKAPKGPAIAASASGLSGGTSFGNHAEIHLAIRAGNSETLTNFRIDLTAAHRRKGGIKIRIQPLKFSWAAPETSTMWPLTDGQAMAAMARAVEFQGQQSELSYQRFGVGPKQYNCALFVQEILRAAGIERGAGLMISTPLEVAKGRKLPSFGKRKAKAPVQDPNYVPPQYEV